MARHVVTAEQSIDQSIILGYKSTTIDKKSMGAIDQAFNSPQVTGVAEEHLIILLWHVPLADGAGLAVEALPRPVVQDAASQVLVVFQASSVSCGDRKALKSRIIE